MCGYRCTLCKAYAPNIELHDEREALSQMWSKYYDLDIPPEKIYCEGCRTEDDHAKRLDMNCPVRLCVIDRHIDHCGKCLEFPCAVFRERQGLSYNEAKKNLGDDFCAKEYRTYLVAFDNFTRLTSHDWISKGEVDDGTKDDWGVLDFSLVGILSKISGVLATNQIGIFAISTFNTDYILVEVEDFEKALTALEAAGYRVNGGMRIG